MATPQKVPTKSTEFNPRYARWVEVTSGGANHEFTAWVSRHAADCRKSLGIHRFVPLPRDVFDAYLLGPHECPCCVGEGELVGTDDWGHRTGAACHICKGSGEVDIDTRNYFSKGQP